MTRLPRDVSGAQLARLLEKYGYQITRQTGSHIRLTTQMNGEHHVTLPVHKELRVRYPECRADRHCRSFGHGT